MGPTNTEGNRPYPDGYIWDEAWRQRQRADAYARGLEELENLLVSNHSLSYQDDAWWVWNKGGEGMFHNSTIELLVLTIAEQSKESKLV